MLAEFFPFLLKINPLQTKASQKNLNEIVESEDLAHSKLVSRGVSSAFQDSNIIPSNQRQQLGWSQEPAFSGGLSHVLLSLLGPAPPYGKEARCTSTCCLRIRACLFVLVAETKRLAYSLFGLRRDSLQLVFLRGSPKAGVTRSCPAFFGHGMASPALVLSQTSRNHGPKQHQDLELRHRQLIPLSWPPQHICLVGLCLNL